MFTVAFPAYNEESRIEGVIKNYINYSDDIIIIDKYSSDNTATICKKFNNVNIINYPSGIDEANQIKLIIANAKYDWIFFTTCSEFAPKKLLEELVRIIEVSKTFDYRAVLFNRVSYTNGFLTHDLKNVYKKYNQGIYSRFIKKNYFDEINSRIHFEIPVLANIKQVYVINQNNPLIHIRNDDLSKSELKHNRYADIEAKSLITLNYKPSFFRLFARTIFNFFVIYIQNYKNGFTGFVVSISHAMYIFQVELRLLCFKYNYNKETIELNNIKALKKFN